MSCGLDFLRAGKSHLCRAVTHHEESVREASLCKKLRNIEVLQEVLSAAHQRSRLKYTQLREDYDLLNLIDVPDIICEWPGCRCQVQSVPGALGRSSCRGRANPRCVPGTGTGPRAALALVSSPPHSQIPGPSLWSSSSWTPWWQLTPSCPSTRHLWRQGPATLVLSALTFLSTLFADCLAQTHLPSCHS